MVAPTKAYRVDAHDPARTAASALDTGGTATGTAASRPPHPARSSSRRPAWPSTGGTSDARLAPALGALAAGASAR